jgi:putative flippase GtrA
MVIRHTIMELVRFGLVGVLNTLFGLFMILALMYLAGVDYLLANAVGYSCGITLSYFINRSWTFRHKGSMFQSAILWGKVTAVAYAANLGVVVVVHEYFGTEGFASQLFGVVAYSSLSYLGGKFYAFHQQAQSSLELPA